VGDDGCCHVSELLVVVADIYAAVAVSISVVVLAGIIVAVTDVSRYRNFGDDVVVVPTGQAKRIIVLSLVKRIIICIVPLGASLIGLSRK
jgi:hypothetical protein